MDDIEKQNLDVEKRRLALEERFSKKYAVPIVSVLVAVIAGLFALAQVWVASINKEKELELSKLQNERKWKLDIATFVFENRNVIFSNNLKEQRCLRDVILVTFPSEVTARLFERIEVAVPSEQKMVWQEAQELVSKEAAIEAAQTEALTLFRQGNYEASVSANNKALESDPNNVKILNRKGYSLFRSKRFDEALKTFSQALQLQPDHELANLNLAKVLCAAGRPTDAEKSLKAAIKLKPALLQSALADGELIRTCGQILGNLVTQKRTPD